MRKTSETHDSDVSMKVEPFTVDWPADLNPQPLFKIQVSPTRSAYVYEDSEHSVQVNNGVPVTQKGYRLMFVITKTGLPPIKTDNYNNRYGGGYGFFYNNLLDVRYCIVEYSQACRPRVVTTNQKVKQVVGTEEYEDQ